MIRRRAFRGRLVGVLWPVLGLTAAEAGAQEGADLYPLPGDVETVDGIIRAYYEVVSVPAGEMWQTERDRSLHHPDARAIQTGVDEEGTPFIRNLTLEEFHARQPEGGSDTGFFESEIHRETQRFGNVAHVWSTYAWRTEEDGPVRGRGINSIQLYHDGDRWWITAWIYDSEREGNRIPPEYLPDGN